MSYSLSGILFDSITVEMEASIAYVNEPPLNVSLTPSLVDNGDGDLTITFILAFTGIPHITPQSGSFDFNYLYDISQEDEQEFDLGNPESVPVVITNPTAESVTITPDLAP